MKKLALLLIGLLFLHLGFSQKQQVKLKNPIVYQVDYKNDSLIFLPSEINLEVAEWAFDSCNYYDNSFELQFEIKNNTKAPVLCNKVMDCWNDSGLSNYSTLRGEPITILPGKTGKITIRVMPYQKRRMSPSTQFVIFQSDKSLIIPLRLKFECTSVKHCVSLQNQTDGPANN